MLDSRGREIDYLRISITDRCNLRCIYCMPEEGVKFVSHQEILTYDEIVRIVRCMAENLGLRKIKVTGGEPLVRKGVSSLIQMLKEIPGIEKVTLTTNGILLKEQLPSLTAAGLDAVNVSLDTLDPRKFMEITRRDELEQVLAGILEAVTCPGLTVKVNAVPVLADPDNLCALAKLALDYPIHVRYIEMMPIGQGREFPFVGEDRIVQLLEKRFGPLKAHNDPLGNGPGHYYHIDGFQGSVGFISAMTHQFCDRCNRVRLTSTGYLKPCLQFDTGKDLKALIRGGVTDTELTSAIRMTVWFKPGCHMFSEKQFEGKENKRMSQIGG